MTSSVNRTPSNSDLPPSNGGKPPDEDGEKEANITSVSQQTDSNISTNVTNNNEYSTLELDNSNDQDNASIIETPMKGGTNNNNEVIPSSTSSNSEADQKTPINDDYKLNFHGPIDQITLELGDKAAHLKANSKRGWTAEDSDADHNPLHVNWLNQVQQASDARRFAFDKEQEARRIAFLEEETKMLEHQKQQFINSVTTHVPQVISSGQKAEDDKTYEQIVQIERSADSDEAAVDFSGVEEDHADSCTSHQSENSEQDYSAMSGTKTDHSNS